MKVAPFPLMIITFVMVSSILTSTANALPILYSETLGTAIPAVSTPLAPGVFANCKAAEGCYATAGNNDVVGGNMPDTFTFPFNFTAAQIAQITGGPVTAKLSVTASRDFGIRTGNATSDEFLVTSADGTALGNLFQNTTSTCPAGERGGPGYPQDLNCGPNYHTDVQATDFLAIANIQADVADGLVNIVLDPTNGGNSGEYSWTP